MKPDVAVLLSVSASGVLATDVNALTSSLASKADELARLSRRIDLDFAELREKIKQTRAHVNGVRRKKVLIKNESRKLNSNIFPSDFGAAHSPELVFPTLRSATGSEQQKRDSTLL